MNDTMPVVVDYIQHNKKPLAQYLRSKMIQAGAKSYVDQLGREGIQQQEKEAAGLLLDLACALLRRLFPNQQIEAEDFMARFPLELKSAIHLPRSESYYQVVDELTKPSNSTKVSPPP